MDWSAIMKDITYTVSLIKTWGRTHSATCGDFPFFTLFLYEARPRPYSVIYQKRKMSLLSSKVLTILTFIAIHFHDYGAAAPPPAPAPQGDQCGPYPPNPSVSDTCTAPLLSSPTDPQIWGMSCFPQGSADDTVTISDCMDVRDKFCKKVSDPTQLVQDQWSWAKNTNAKCAIGYWSPASHVVNGVQSKPAPPPTYDRCMNDILTPLINECANGAPTMQAYAGINVVYLPDKTQTGQTIKGGENYWSYIVAADPLTNVSIAGGSEFGFAFARFTNGRHD
ncbi:hypothetical protein ACLMJK_008712 [Lecanora helva]